jgi:glycosyltransferase involved in cell wall biosynthesis
MGLVSVIMPVRNAAPFLRAAADSVLGQADVELELIIVEDGSSDRSSAIARQIRDPRLRIIDGPGRGIGGARNAGLAVARGSIIACCDADDVYTPHRLSWQVDWLERQPAFAAVCGRLSTMDCDGSWIADLDCGSDAPAEITAELLAGKTRTSLCTFAVRAAALRKIHGFREYFVTAEDIDLQLRLSEVGRVWYEPRFCYHYRLHDASVTHTQGRAQRVFFEEKAREFAGQRQAGRLDDLQRGEPPPVPVGWWPGAPSAADHIQGLLLGQAWRAHAAARKLEALRTAWRACWAQPRNWPAWKSLVALVLKRRSDRWSRALTREASQ